MKKICYSILMICAGLATVACNNDSAPVPQGTVTASVEGQEIPFYGGVVEYVLESNCDWEIVVPVGSTLSVSPLSGGEGTATLAVAVPKNTGREDVGLYFTACFTNADGLVSEKKIEVVVPKPSVTYGGVTYDVVYLADGNYWMAENLRYVPEGKTVSSDYTADDGLWYPAGKDLTANPSLVETKGLLYDFATAFGVDEITEANAGSFEGKRGICPEGWHIPTNSEMTGLVGANSNSALNQVDAPYYDVDQKGAPIDALDADGFNWTFVGMRNKTTLTGKGSYLLTSYNDVDGALSYVLGSTNYSVKKDTEGNVTNCQFYSLMSTYTASYKRITVAYANVMAGHSMRCVLDK